MIRVKELFPSIYVYQNDMYLNPDEGSDEPAQNDGKCDTVGTVTKFIDPISWAVNRRVGLLKYPNQATGLQVLLGSRLPLGTSVQCQDVLLVPK